MDTQVLEAHFEYLKSGLKEVQICVKDMKKDLVKIKIDVARLQIKAGIWGFAAGLLPVLAGIGFWVLKSLV